MSPTTQAWASRARRPRSTTSRATVVEVRAAASPAATCSSSASRRVDPAAAARDSGPPRRASAMTSPATSAMGRAVLRAWRRSRWNAASGSRPSRATSTPLACSIRTRLVSACRNWPTSVWLASSRTPPWTTPAISSANASSPPSSSGVQGRGLLA